MALQLVLGAAGVGKTHYLCEEMLKTIHQNKNKNYIYIVPDQFTFETQKKMVNMRNELFGGAGIMNVDIVSFNRLAFRVFEEQGFNKLSVLDDTGKNLILRKVIEENKEDLLVYRDKSGMIGFISEMKSVISELYQYGVDIDSLEDIIQKIKGHAMTVTKLKDIKYIYTKFREYVNGMGEDGVKYITKEEVLQELINFIPKSDIIKSSYIVLDGYTGFTPVQYKLLKLLMEYSLGVSISITIRTKGLDITSTGFKEIKEQELFNMSKDTINRLYATSADAHCQILSPVIINGDKGRHKNNEALAYLEESLFEYDKKPYDKEVSSISIYKVDNTCVEASVVINKIAALMKNDKTLRYRDIAVITGDDNLMITMDRFLSAANIPHFIDNKKSIIRNPFVDSIRALLEMIDTNYKYESVFRYLRCGLANVTMEQIDAFENYCLALGIKGKKKFSNKFTKLPRRTTIEQVDAIEKTRELVMTPIFELQEELKGANVKQICTAIYNFVTKCQLKKRLSDFVDMFEKNNQMTYKLEYSQVYKKVMELFDKIVMLLGDESIKLSAFRKLLDSGFEEIKVGLIPLVVDQLIIGDITRTRLSDLKILFVVGANDGVIPKHSDKGGLLSATDRTVLKDLNIELSPNNRESSFIQKFYLYLSLTKPSEEVIISYSQSGSDGKTQRPSYLIDTIMDMYPNGKLVRNADLKKLDQVFDKEAMFNHLVSELNNYKTNKEDLQFLELFRYFAKDDDYKTRLYKSIEGAFFANRVGSLEEAIAKQLYENDVVNSATRLEKYAACAYAHFLEYGLNIVKRQIYELKSTDIGTIYHKCVEQFTIKLRDEQIALDTIDDKKRTELIHESMEYVVKHFDNDTIFESSQNKFILAKCEKVANKTAWAIVEHLKLGNFNPKYFELKVENGRVDRVDVLDLDGTRYVKVIDYKSGDTKFSTTDVMQGLRLQLLFYMDSVLERERKQNPNMRVEPAAVFYFNIKDPVIDFIPNAAAGAYEHEALKEFVMTGFVNSKLSVVENLDKMEKKKGIVSGIKEKMIDEPVSFEKNFGVGSSYTFEQFILMVKDKAKNIAENILQGNIELNPYYRNGKTPCRYCEFKSVCNFDCRNFDNKYNNLLKDTKENYDFLSKTFVENYLSKTIYNLTDKEGKEE